MKRWNRDEQTLPLCTSLWFSKNVCVLWHQLQKISFFPSVWVSLYCILPRKTKPFSAASPSLLLENPDSKQPNNNIPDITVCFKEFGKHTNYHTFPSLQISVSSQLTLTHSRMVQQSYESLKKMQYFQLYWKKSLTNISLISLQSSLTLHKTFVS